MSNKKKVDSKTLGQQKRHRRQWITFIRMCRYGVNNFSRNAWLTIAATGVMTITLFIIFTSFAARNILLDTVATIRDQVNMSIYLAPETTDEEADLVIADLRKLDSVTKVTYISPSEARQDFVEQNKNDENTLDAVKEATNRFPGVLSIKLVDINDTSELAEFTKSNEPLLAVISDEHEPSFAGQRRATIQTIGQAVNFAEKVGIAASLVFVSMSMLIIFNTIRMAIFNRREEIQMMKLIGAEKSFIRGPFVVEAIVYGFIAALIATGLAIGAIYAVRPTLIEYQINVQPTIDLITYYLAFVLLVMIAIGAFIGIVSSLLATRRYLK